MTRKARCGNTQKHTKMPGDATPWEELSQGIKMNVGSNKSSPEKKATKECVEKPQPIEETREEPSVDIEKVNPLEGPSSEVNQDIETTDHNPTKNKNKEYKKKMALERLKQRRLENGVTLLSQKQERKLYLIKKRLRQKGMPPEAIRDIIRKKRRAEEIQFRKTFTTKTCFNCREQGHLLSNCPQRLGATNQVTGVCFKCGSTEHVSYRCQKNVSGYPLAKCFICKEQGHISKDCPKNKNGMYIKGGCCNICGNVNHLQKDCPTLRKKKEHIVPVYTISQGRSIDDEIVEDATVTRKKIRKQPKVVKF